ncbi:MAG TPA: HPF/RaiA family ribosome-associated protein [Sandaracinaceae bacterium LLY-WYZ-13_1]|nr:HPF/RaiA family ribosome-associated protein [Sandaracinaceae bacterium LLY-WYZ-13_1]
MRIGVRAKGTALDEALVSKARTKLRCAVGRHAAAVRGAAVRLAAEETLRCRVRLHLVDGGTVETEVVEPELEAALELAIDRAAAALARAMDTARVWGSER